jgi:hypothetical protein
MCDLSSLPALVGTHIADTETDFRAELPLIRKPTLIIHGDSDELAPLTITSERVRQMISGSRLKVYKDGPHGLMISHMDQLNRDPQTFINVLNEIAALTLLRGADFPSVLGQPQREAMAMLFLDLHRYGYVIGWIFGPWLFFFGLLVFKSGFLPRILGVLLIAACFGYLADSLTPLLLPSYANLVGRIANTPLTLGEPAIILWLLIMGAKDQPLEATA